MAFEDAAVPERADYVFMGYFTELNGGGYQTHDSQGRATGFGTLRTIGDDRTTLYAVWREASEFYDEFVVTKKADDAGTNYSDGDVSLREAFNFLMDHPYAVNANGERKILFADALVAANPDGVTLTLDGPIVVDRPIGSVALEGSSATRLRIDANINDAQFKFTGSYTNQVAFRNVTFHNAKYWSSNGASCVFAEGNATVDLTNCRFDDNGGSAVVTTSNRKIACRFCSFVSSGGTHPQILSMSSSSNFELDVVGCTFDVAGGSAISMEPRRVLTSVQGRYRVRNSTFHGCPSGAFSLPSMWESVFLSLDQCVFLDVAALVAGVEPEMSRVRSVETTCADAVEGGAAATAEVEGVVQTYFPIRRLGPLDGAGERVVGIETDILGNEIKDPSNGVWWCAVGSHDPGWERPRCRVDQMEDVDDPCDGRISISEALRYARDTLFTRNVDGGATVTFAETLFASADAEENPVFDCRWPFAVANTNVTSRIRVLGPASGCGATLRSAWDATQDGWFAVAGDGAALDIRNLAFADGTNATGAAACDALLYARDGGRLFASNCLFTASSATSAVRGACNGQMTFLCSSFDGDGAAFRIVEAAAPSLLVASTVRAPFGTEIGGNPFYLLQSTLARRDAAQTLPSGCVTNGCCVFETGTATRAAATTVRVGSVSQLVYEPNRAAPLAGEGYFLYHDASWENVARARLRDGLMLTSVMGSAAAATELFDLDVAGARTRARRNTAGSRTIVEPEANALVVDSAEDDWDADDPWGWNDVDGRITLRDCLLAASENGELVNGEGEREVTFAPTLSSADGSPIDVRLAHEIAITNRATILARLRVQGSTNRTVRVLGPSTCRFLNALTDVDLHFRDLCFGGFGAENVDGGLVATARGIIAYVLFENTRVTSSGQRGGVVYCASLGGVTFVDSTIYGCRAVEGGFACQVTGRHAVRLVHSTVYDTSASLDHAGSLWKVVAGEPLMLQSTYVRPESSGAPTAFAGVGAWTPAASVVWDTEATETVPRVMDDAVEPTNATTVVRAVPQDAFAPIPFGSADGLGGQVYHSADWHTVTTNATEGLIRKTTDQIGNPIPDETTRGFAPSAGAVCQSWEQASLSVTRGDCVVDSSDGETSLPEALTAAQKCVPLLGEDGKMTIDFDKLVAGGGRTVTATEALQVPALAYPVVLRGPMSGTGVEIVCDGSTTTVLSSVGALELQNLTFRDAEDAAPETTFVVSADGDESTLFVSNCCFAAQTAVEGSGARAIRAAGRKLTVVQSSFDVQGAALDDASEIGAVVESTVLETEVSRLPETALVADTFATSAPEQDTPRSAGCVFGRDDLLTGCDGVVETNRAGSVDQLFFTAHQPGAFAGTGAFAWHDADWSVVAWSTTTNAAETALIGELSAATNRFDCDVRNARIAANHNSRGSYACPPDGLRTCVNTLGDDETGWNDADGILSLREAFNIIPEEKAEDEGRVLTFEPSLFTNGVGTIRLKHGQFELNAMVVVVGPGAAELVLDAAQLGRHLAVTGRTAVVRNLTFANGAAPDRAGSLLLAGPASCEISNCVFRSNVVTGGSTAGWGGGAINAAEAEAGDAGSLDVVDSVFAGNVAAGTLGGGAIVVNSQRRASVRGCRFEGNTAGDVGGAIRVNRDAERVRIENSSFAGNESGGGGGAVYGESPLVVVNASFVRNEAGDYGGALFFDSAASGVLLANCTFRANASAKKGGGVAVNQAESMSLLNVISLDNDAGDDASATQDSRKTADLYVAGASATNLAGVVARKAAGFSQNVERLLYMGTSSSFANGTHVFEGSKNETGGNRVQVRSVSHPVERLKRISYNKALAGVWVKHDDDWRNVTWATSAAAAPEVVVGAAASATTRLATDITGRKFEIRQMGNFWSQADVPSLEVDTAQDVVDEYDGQLSLREVVARLAEGDARYEALKGEDGVYHVTFADALGDETIRLVGTQWDVEADAPVEIDGENRITVNGTSCETVTEHGETFVLTNAFRAFRVMAGSELRVKNMTFVENVGMNDGTVPSTGFDGGAILNWGTLEAEGCTFLRCAAGRRFANPVAYGGGVCNGAPLVTGATAKLKDCAFEACRAARGGAVYNYAGNTVEIEGCAFVSNRAGGGTAVLTPVGGAMCNERNGTLSYSGSSFDDNTALLDGAETPSDYTHLAQPFYVVKAANGTVAVTLNQLAAPGLSGADSFTVAGDVVQATPSNVKPGLYYALGYAFVLGAEFRIDPGSWVRADEGGNLPGPLTAPKGKDCGFYRIFVSIGPGD